MKTSASINDSNLSGFVSCQFENKISLLISPREKEVLFFLVRGFTAKMISLKLHISPRTVEQHLENIKRKVGLHTKTQLIETFLEDFR